MNKKYRFGRKKRQKTITSGVGSNLSPKKEAVESGAERCDSHHLVEGDKKIPSISQITIMNPLKIIDLAKTQPNSAALYCQTAISTLTSGFNNRKHELLGAACGIAYNMVAVQGEWRLFCQKEFWKGFKRRPRQSSKGTNKALWWVMRFLFLARTKNEINITNRYAAMLLEEYNTGVAPEKIAGIIKGYGGIEKMRRARVEIRRDLRLKKIHKKVREFEEELESDFGNKKKKNKGKPAKERNITKLEYEHIKLALLEFQDKCEIYFRNRMN